VNQKNKKMKTILTKFLALSSIALLMLASCKKDGAIVKTNGGTPGALTATTTSPVLDKTKLSDTTKIINFSFSQPNFGYAAAVTNTLQIDPAGDNWKNPMSVTLGAKVLSQGYSTSDFNSLLLKLNLTAGVATQVNVRIQHSIGTNVAPVYSNTLALTVTPFNLTSWLWITGQFSGWVNVKTPSAEDSLVSVTGNGIYTGIINFPAGENQFLILPVKGDWGHKYATTDAQGSTSSTVTYDGPNNYYAPAAAGQYWVTINTNNNTISFALADYYSVIGDAAQGWGTDVDMKYINDGNQTWTVTLPLTVELPPNDGYKVRKDHAWAVSYGTNAANNGTLVTSGAINIGNAVAGTYKITFWLNPADNTGNTAFYTAVKQ
jgi:hypothetical protein